MSRTAIARRLRALAAQGILPSARYLLRGHGGVVAEVLAEFGSIPRARDAARLDAPPQPADADEVVKGLRVLHAAGTKIDLPTLLRLGEAGLITAARRAFGGLDAAAAAAGVTVGRTPMHLRVSRNALARAPGQIATPRRDRATPSTVDMVSGARRRADLAVTLRQIDRAGTAAGRQLRAALDDLLPRFVADATALLLAGVQASFAAAPRRSAAADQLKDELTGAVRHFADAAVAGARGDVLARAVAALQR